MLSKARISHVRSLHSGKFRVRHKEFIAEGPRIARELLSGNWEITGIYATRQWMEHMPESHTAAELFEVSDKELRRISALKSPQEVLLTVRMKKEPEQQGSDGPLVVMLDRISDPGNLGSIIRSADWFGISTVICSEDCADLYNPRVIQATMGSFMRVGVRYCDLPSYLQQNEYTAYGAFMKGRPVYEIKINAPAAIVIGNESTGISEELSKTVDHQVTIPSPSHTAESLNASVAAGILMNEFHRQLQRP